MSAANTARTFVNDVVRPSLDEWDSAARYPRAAVAGSGLTGMFVARERGGLGLTYTEAIDGFEEGLDVLGGGNDFDREEGKLGNAGDVAGEVGGEGVDRVNADVGGEFSEGFDGGKVKSWRRMREQI